MALRYDRKAMAAIIDALMFITVIGLIVAGMFAYSNMTDERETIAKDVHDTFFGIELRMDDMFEDTDGQSVRMCDLVAAYMASGKGDVLLYIKDILSSIIPPTYSYLYTFEYGGRTLTVGDKGNKLTSQYSSDVMISDGKMMRTSLSLY